jgi:hypothetical protein
MIDGGIVGCDAEAEETLWRFLRPTKVEKGQGWLFRRKLAS